MAALKTAINEPESIFISWLRFIDPNMASQNAAMLIRSAFQAKLEELDRGDPLLSLETYKKFLTRKLPQVNANKGYDHNKGDQKMIRILADVLTLAMGGQAQRAPQNRVQKFTR